MKIIRIKNKKILNDFVSAQKQSQFLQSWEWGEFQKSLGFEIFHFGLEEDKKLKAVATLIKKPLPGYSHKSYFFCPRGPIFSKKLKVESIKFLFEEIKNLAKKENAIFLRFEPKKEIHNSQFTIHNSINIQPSQTLILNITTKEDDLLAQMHKKTRYNVRLAEKKGVKIEELKIEEFEDFWQIMSETGQRDGFKTHTKKYYRQMFEFRGDFLKFYVAKYKDKIIAGLIAGFYGDMATYLHGASANEYRNLMAPHLLQWRTITEAKKRGIEFYDFHGFDEQKWPGVSRFKKGFGGEIKKYPGTFDMIFSQGWYSLYVFFRWVRRRF